MTDAQLATLETTMQAIAFTSDELTFIKEKYAPNATDMEWKEYIALAQMHGANPLKKQIHFIKYGDKAAITFDYKFKVQKARLAGSVRGFTNPVWFDDKGTRYDMWPHDPVKTPPFYGEIGVFLVGETEPMWVSLYWRERFKAQAEWKKQPLHMMEKCLISKATDRYSEAVAGMPIVEEMMVNPSGEWVHDDTRKPSEQTAEIAGKARDRGRARDGDLRDLSELKLSEDQPECKKMLSAIRHCFKDLGLGKGEKVSKVNEILKALELDTVSTTNELTMETAEKVKAALDQEVRDLQSGNLPEDPLFKEGE